KGLCFPSLVGTIAMVFTNPGDSLVLVGSAGVAGAVRPGPEGRADLEAFLRGPVINDLVTFDPLEKTFTTTSDTTGCPPLDFEGKFIFDAKLTNTSPPSAPPLSDLRARVTTLTNGNILQNNILQNLGGVGAELGIPGKLSSGQSVDVPFN